MQILRFKKLFFFLDYKKCFKYRVKTTREKNKHEKKNFGLDREFGQMFFL